MMKKKEGKLPAWLRPERNREEKRGYEEKNYNKPG